MPRDQAVLRACPTCSHRFLSRSAGCRTCRDCQRKEADCRARPFTKKPTDDEIFNEQFEEYFDLTAFSASAREVRDEYEQRRMEERRRRSCRYRKLRFEAD